MKLNKTHLMLSTSDLGGFRGFEVPRDAIPALDGLTDKDLQCRNVKALVALQVSRYAFINKLSDVCLRGVLCMLGELPKIEEDNIKKKFDCGLYMGVFPTTIAVNWCVLEEDARLIAQGQCVTVAQAIKQVEDAVEEYAAK